MPGWSTDHYEDKAGTEYDELRNHLIDNLLAVFKDAGCDDEEAAEDAKGMIDCAIALGFGRAEHDRATLGRRLGEPERDVEPDEAHADGYCPKCNADTTHLVLERYLETIRRVQCAVCGNIHGYKQPRAVPDPGARSEGEDDGSHT